VLPLKREAL